MVRLAQVAGLSLGGPFKFAISSSLELTKAVYISDSASRCSEPEAQAVADPDIQGEIPIARTGVKAQALLL